MRLLHWRRGKKDNHKMATHGRLEKFEPEKDDWTIYVESLCYYFLANEVTTEAKKRSILLTCCGRGTLKLFRSLVDDPVTKYLVRGNIRSGADKKFANFSPVAP